MSFENPNQGNSEKVIINNSNQQFNPNNIAAPAVDGQEAEKNGGLAVAERETPTLEQEYQEQISNDLQYLSNEYETVTPRRKSLKERVGNFFGGLGDRFRNFFDRGESNSDHGINPGFKDTDINLLKDHTESLSEGERGELMKIESEQLALSKEEIKNHAEGIQELNDNPDQAAKILAKRNINWKKMLKFAVAGAGIAATTALGLPAILSIMGYGVSFATGTSVAGTAALGGLGVGSLGTFGSIGLSTATIAGWGAYMGAGATAASVTMAGTAGIGTKWLMKKLDDKPKFEKTKNKFENIELTPESLEQINILTAELMSRIDDKFENFPLNGPGVANFVANTAKEIYTTQILNPKDDPNGIQQGEPTYEGKFDYGLQEKADLDDWVNGIVEGAEQQGLITKDEVIPRPETSEKAIENYFDKLNDELDAKYENFPGDSEEFGQILSQIAYDRYNQQKLDDELSTDGNVSASNFSEDIKKAIQIGIDKGVFTADQIIEKTTKPAEPETPESKEDDSNLSREQKVDKKAIKKISADIKENLIDLGDAKIENNKSGILNNLQSVLKDRFEQFNSQHENQDIKQVMDKINAYIDTKAYESSSAKQIKSFFELRLKDLKDIKKAIKAKPEANEPFVPANLAPSKESEQAGNVTDEMKQILNRSANNESPLFSSDLSQLQSDIKSNNGFLGKDVVGLINKSEASNTVNVPRSNGETTNGIILAIDNNGAALTAFVTAQGHIATKIVNSSDLVSSGAPEPTVEKPKKVIPNPVRGTNNDNIPGSPTRVEDLLGGDIITNQEVLNNNETAEQKSVRFTENQIDDLQKDIEKLGNQENAAFHVLAQNGKLLELDVDYLAEHANFPANGIKAKLEYILTTKKLEQMKIADNKENRKNNKFDLSTIGDVDLNGNSTWQPEAMAMVSEAFEELKAEIKGTKPQQIDNNQENSGTEQTNSTPNASSFETDTIHNELSEVLKLIESNSDTKTVMQSTNDTLNKIDAQLESLDDANIKKQLSGKVFKIKNKITDYYAKGNVDIGELKESVIDLNSYINNQVRDLIGYEVNTADIDFDALNSMI